jgi:NAD+--dinitrogen-reductase ADP-D-ribosyltransferase
MKLYRGVLTKMSMNFLKSLTTGKACSSQQSFIFHVHEERAWEFGFTVWEVQVPICKIFFFNELLPNSIMKGEGSLSSSVVST